MAAEQFRHDAEVYRNSLYDPENEDVLFSLAYQWTDKPHRHVHDLCRRLDTAADLIETQAREIERLRGVLRRWQYSGCPDCSGDCGSANPPVMCCIMEETRAALGENND